MPSHMKQ